MWRKIRTVERSTMYVTTALILGKVLTFMFNCNLFCSQWFIDLFMFNCNLFCSQWFIDLFMFNFNLFWSQWFIDFLCSILIYFGPSGL